MSLCLRSRLTYLESCNLRSYPSGISSLWLRY
nr:MAG TPA: hypothetical protein [Caudoviricetes sp.]